MSISTTDKPEDKRDKLKKLREFHQKTLDALGVSDALFIPKMAYRPYGKTELHIAFFASEINKGEDVYVEFASKELVPEDPERRLYKWRFNPHFEEEYEKTDPHPVTGHFRYLVPTEELIRVKEIEVEGEALPPIVSNTGLIDFDLVDANSDLPLDQLTIRDIAAILLKKPVSQKPWLNEIIKQS